ncbi:hypothetical protein [Bradyrhizobium sp. BWA-3-5]|uniref:hypothetical protein n=1 Tax=Bradyrhizobium sp. BWA-3-5 TaxID=3080013 RepID=UPI00293F2ED0|nr:hypothetical protein [Bradyrhizobium sp. BWA-3-5]WOH64165.1 hypothetical protein RX331_26715 [Bradyrhizobium sp. BWA-3-5]WOH64282.1 hypothetical protein RX331_27455 [Bradyrhizobium sp. BWA-3-5]WOH70209.1 hypothetical protein RX331_38640 [Bradyrhizobium sp. BWA-3-5]
MTALYALPLRFLSVPLQNLVKFVTLIQVKIGPDPNLTGPQPVEPAVHVHRCDARVQHLKQSIEQQIEEVARLICEGKNALEAAQALNELTSELIAARLGFCPEREQLTGSAVTSGGVGQLIREQSIVYDPEQLSDLGRIFDEAFAGLPKDLRTPTNRTEIARLIFGRAVISKIELGPFIRFIIAIASAV